MTGGKEECSLPLRWAEECKIKNGQNQSVGLGEEVLNDTGSLGEVWPLKPVKVGRERRKGGCCRGIWQHAWLPLM